MDFDFLLTFYAIKKPSVEADKAINMLRLTLEKIFEGGVHDHVGKVCTTKYFDNSFLGFSPLFS